jgi:FAD/FMN-containing dehydrogenase
VSVGGKGVAVFVGVNVSAGVSVSGHVAVDEGGVSVVWAQLLRKNAIHKTIR